MGPLVLLPPMVQTGQGSPRFQAVFPPGPSNSPVSSPLPESCSLPLLGGAQLHKPPMLVVGGSNTVGSNPGSRSKAGDRAEATCVVCHICKESMAQSKHHRDWGGR